MSETFQAYQIGKNDDGQRCTLTQLSDSDLMDGDVTVRVDYTTLNYKDGLALTGRSPIQGDSAESWVAGHLLHPPLAFDERDVDIISDITNKSIQVGVVATL